MKKYRLLAALLAALLFSAAGCGGAVNAPGATDKPGAETPGAEASGAEAPGETPESADIRYGSRTNTVYFPEGAGDADADYILTYTLPVFMPEELNCAALNAALALYEEELTERVRTERLPLADRAEGEPAPCTTVEFAASSAAGYWSIRLFETVSRSCSCWMLRAASKALLRCPGNMSRMHSWRSRFTMRSISIPTPISET